MKQPQETQFLSLQLVLRAFVHQKFIHQTRQWSFSVFFHQQVIFNIGSGVMEQSKWAAGDRLHTTNSSARWPTLLCPAVVQETTGAVCSTESVHGCNDFFIKHTSKHSCCSCISDKVAVHRVFAVASQHTCCYHCNHRCCQINQDWNLKDYYFKHVHQTSYSGRNVLVAVRGNSAGLYDKFSVRFYSRYGRTRPRS